MQGMKSKSTSIPFSILHSQFPLRPGQLHLHPGGRGTIEEQGVLALRALMRLWLAGRQAELGSFLKCSADIINSQAEVMQPRPMLAQPGPQRVILDQRLNELKLRIA